MKYLITAINILASLSLFSQVFPRADYPRNYFRNPLNIPMSLAANFGELRPNHYHMGLDIRTQKRENLPVFAAADGYIARVVIEPGGFGQAIYINHPNGYTTLYAHLNKFMPALAAYIEERQYRLRTWSIQVDIPAGAFPVKKGEQIAYSGNTGGSQGPHLHFEIRTTRDDVNQNPLLFGLPVPDNTPPVITRLAVYDRDKSTYEQSPRILAVRKAAGGYAITPGLITVSSPLVSFAISAFDSQSGSTNPNGIFQAVLSDNGRPLVGFQMNRISYDHTRNLNAHIDYKTRATGGPFLQHLSALPGYTPPTIYRSFPASAGNAGSDSWPYQSPYDGVIDCSDGAVHEIRIVVWDANGNNTSLQYQVQFRKAAGGGNNAAASTVAAGMEAPVQPAVVSAKMFYPGMLDGFETADCAFYLGEKSLYDSVHIRYYVSAYAGSGNSLPDGISAVHHIGEPWIPLQDSLLVRIRPNNDFLNLRKDKVVMVCFNGSKKDVRRPAWLGGLASARFREFGNFQLVEDKVPPVITPIGISDGANLAGATRIAFTVKDNLGSTTGFYAELDPPANGGRGNWLCFTNDKGLAYIYKFDGHCPKGKHILRVSVEDVAGNVTTKDYSFTR